MPLRTKAQVPVGSAQWIQDENRQISQFGVQEAEDFAFSARNEIEWLNEHMAEIFSKNQVNVCEIFKTPGKLRGKTPRTNRKRNPLDIRQPLTNIFSTKASLNINHSPAHNLPREMTSFHVAEDPSPPASVDQPSKQNTDSGYHGMSEDDVEVDHVAAIALPIFIAEEALNDQDPEKSPTQPQKDPKSFGENKRTTEGSFHSAKEDLTKTVPDKEIANLFMDTGINSDPEPQIPLQAIPGPFSPNISSTVEVILEDAMDLGGIGIETDLEENNSIDALDSASPGSSPAKPLIRKSSLTFAALPAREPLAMKKSIGSRLSGTAHLDQSRATMSRGSFLGRYTGGKSLGGMRQADPITKGSDDAIDTDQAGKGVLPYEEPDGDIKMARLHNKSSTQRLHDKINMLGKSQPARPTKSTSVAAAVTLPLYPDLPLPDSQPPNSEQNRMKATDTNQSQNEDDDDDWIQPPEIEPKDMKQSQLPKAISTTFVDNIKGKEETNDQDREIGYHDRDAAGELLQSELPNYANRRQAHSRPAPFAANASPLKSTEKDQIEVFGKPGHPIGFITGNDGGPQISTTPLGTPASRRYVDGPLSASKTKLQSIMKTARGLFTSSAGVSAQAKMETMSPHSMRTRGQAQGPASGDKLKSKLKVITADIEASSVAQSAVQLDKQVQEVTVELHTKSSFKMAEGRKTRSSTEKEEKRKELESKDQQRLDSELQRVRELESRKAAAQRQEPQKSTIANVNNDGEAEQDISLNGEQPPKQTRKSPRRLQNLQEMKKTVDFTGNQDIVVQDSLTNNTMAPPPNHSQVSQLQKPKDLRRPIRPAKDAIPKAKPQQVAIRVGTLSRRIPLTNAALSSSLQESLAPPQPGLSKKASNASLQASGSNSSLKSSVTSSAPKPRALLAAERKKEQDERETQRKLEQKRENERKRAVQQEELRRHEQAQRQEAELQRERERSTIREDPKKIAQRQAIEKRRLDIGKKEQQRQAAQQDNPQQFSTANRHELGGARPPSKQRTVQDYNRPPNQPLCNPARPPAKRVFELEVDDEPVRSVRMAGGPSYHQLDKKRRRTEDEEVQDLMVRPPIRQSNIRKDAPKQSLFGNNYVGAQQSSNAFHNSSMVKSSTLNQTYQQQQNPKQTNRQGPFFEMAKYTNGKIPFAGAPNPPSKSPLRPKQAAPAPTKSSPQYTNGENIELEDIPTDTDEEESEDEKAKGAMLADWAQSPQLRQILEEQERNANADDIFGPPGSPHMEEMFKERRDRFRSRTSSANWNGSDRLTEEEIRRDIVGRERLRQEGGWFFGL